MTSSSNYTIQIAQPDQFAEAGQLMVSVYSQLDGFPKETEQPAYYKMLANVGELTQQESTELLVAISPEGTVAGAVVYFGNMEHYGAGGTATHEQHAAGFRFLAVSQEARGKGIGKLLTSACIRKANQQKLNQVIIHTTRAMQTAWGMYERIGFRRSADLDFMQGSLQVFGFRYLIQQH